MVVPLTREIVIIALVAFVVLLILALKSEAFRNGVDRFNIAIGKLGGWSILVLTLAMSYEVFARYLLRSPTEWAFDVSYILYGTLFMLAGPYALARNAHVRGDFLYRAWPPRRQAGTDLALYFLFFFPGILALCYAGFGFAMFSWMIGEKSSNSPNGPPLYHFKTLIPLVGLLMTVQGIVEVARCVICLREGEWPARLSDVEETEKLALEKAEAELRAGRAS